MVNISILSSRPCYPSTRVRYLQSLVTCLKRWCDWQDSDDNWQSQRMYSLPTGQGRQRPPIKMLVAKLRFRPQYFLRQWFSGGYNFQTLADTRTPCWGRVLCRWLPRLNFFSKLESLAPNVDNRSIPMPRPEPEPYSFFHHLNHLLLFYSLIHLCPSHGSFKWWGKFFNSYITVQC